MEITGTYNWWIIDLLILVYFNEISIIFYAVKSKKNVKNASKILLQNGTKNKNTSNMHLDHCYACSLSL